MRPQNTCPCGWQTEDFCWALIILARCILVLLLGKVRMRIISIFSVVLILGFPVPVFGQALVIPKNKYGQLYYCKKGQKQFVTVSGRTYKVCTDAEKEARDVVRIFSIPGIVPRGVPRTDLGPSDNSTSETVYDRIDKLAKEDERNRQARMVREAAMPLKGYLGVLPQAMSPGMAMAYKMDATVGEWIKYLQPGGPAEKAGLILGDVIYMVNDQKIEPAAGVRLVDVISNMAAGSLVKLGIFRRDVGPLSYEVVLEGQR